MPVVNLTESRIRDLEPGSGIWRDEQVKGLMVIAHKSTKTYAVQGDVRRNGRHVRTVRVKIDRVDRIALREARRRAKELMSLIQSGVDPTSKPHETGITLKQALEAHLRERPFRPSTEESYRYNVDHALLKFRGRAIADITRAEVRDLYEDLKLKRGKTSAGGAMRVLRALINTAMRIDETIRSNPCAAIRISAPPTRQVEMLDISAWWAETEKLLPMRRDLHRAMLLTGARRTSILTVRRADVDLDRKVLTFQHMKIGPPMTLPMGTRLTEMLRKRLEDDIQLVPTFLGT
jgi:integrase